MARDIPAITYMYTHTHTAMLLLMLIKGDPHGKRFSYNRINFLRIGRVNLYHMSNWSFCTLSTYADLTLERVVLGQFISP